MKVDDGTMHSTSLKLETILSWRSYLRLGTRCSGGPVGSNVTLPNFKWLALKIMVAGNRARCFLFGWTLRITRSACLIESTSGWWRAYHRPVYTKPLVEGLRTLQVESRVEVWSNLERVMSMREKATLPRLSVRVNGMLMWVAFVRRGVVGITY